VPSPELAKALSDLGGFALFLLAVVIAAVGLFRRWYVPGWMYDRLYDDWKLLRDQVDRNSKALDMLAEAARRDLEDRRRASGR
jgi:hypothetical protein